MRVGAVEDKAPMHNNPALNKIIEEALADEFASTPIPADDDDDDLMSSWKKAVQGDARKVIAAVLKRRVAPLGGTADGTSEAEKVDRDLKRFKQGLEAGSAPSPPEPTWCTLF